MAKTPFEATEYKAGAKQTSGDRSEMEAALTKHVYGQRIVKIEWEENAQQEATAQHGIPCIAREVNIYLENDVVYTARIVTPKGFILRSGDALSTLKSTPNLD